MVCQQEILVIIGKNGGHTMNTPTKEIMAKYLQLKSWNKLLLMQGIITEQEFRLMNAKIIERYPIDTRNTH